MPPRVVVRVATPGGEQSRVIELFDVPLGARGRTLALALAQAAREKLRSARGAADSIPEAAPQPEAGALGVANAPLVPVAPVVPPRFAPPGPPSVAFRGGVLTRLVVSPSAPFVGVEAGLGVARVGLTALVLFSQKTTALGVARVAALALSPSVDVVRFTGGVALRLSGEGGAALGSGNPAGSATAHTAPAVHAGLSLGPAFAVPLTPRVALTALTSFGYSASLVAGAEGRDVLGLNGAFAGFSIGVEAR